MSVSQALPQSKNVSYKGHTFTVHPLNFNDLLWLESVGVPVQEAIGFDGIDGKRLLVFVAAHQTSGYEEFTKDDAGVLLSAYSPESYKFLDDLANVIVQGNIDADAPPSGTDDGEKNELTVAPKAARKKKTSTNDSSAG